MDDLAECGRRGCRGGRAVTAADVRAATAVVGSGASPAAAVVQGAVVGEDEAQILA